MQVPRAHNATHTSSEHGAGSRARLLPQGFTGFVDSSPEQGMSGGAVVDLPVRPVGHESKSSLGIGGSIVLLNPQLAAMV